MSYGLKYNWKVGEDYPQWADIPEYLDTISKGYLLEGETPKKAYKRVCKTVAERLGMPYLASKFFKYIWDGWLCLASPVLSNTGTERGLPISCFSNALDDSLHDIAYKNLEMMMLAKNGGGVGIDVSRVRCAGSPIKNNGTSDGVVPFMKMLDSSIQATNQGCYDDQTYVLTNKGWKLFRELDGDELVANVTEDKKINFVNFTDYIEYEVDEDLVKFSSSTGLDLLVTKNHNMAYESKHRPGNRPDLPKTWNEKLKLKTAEEFNPKNWNGFVGTGYKERGREITWEDKFKIAYQADGKKAIYETLDGQKHVTFRLKKQRKIERLRVILSNNNISYKESVQVDDSINFYCYDVPGSLICQTLSWIDLDEFSSIGASQIIEELGHWDGSFTKSGITYSSVERENIDIVQALCVIAQKRSKIRTTVRKPPRQVLYSIHISRDKRYCNQSTHKTYQHYSGKVYCITVPDSRIVVKRGLDGTAVVCGNSARRGAGVFYFDIMHGDFDEIIEVREPKGDVNRQCLNTHLGCTIPEGFMEKVIAGDKECRRRWVKLLQKRKMTGEPYILFLDNANKDRPQSYINNHLYISASNQCSEILLYSDTYNTFVCCLSSLNMAKYDEWKDSDLIKYANYFLDGVMEEFIQSAKSKKGFKYAARTAEKGRAVGLGVLGWHSYLQQKGIPFDSLAATLLTKSIFKNIREESDKASQSLAKKFGEPDWCEGTGYRNTHRLAIAPTTTNAKLAGGVSQSIEPWSANVFTEQTFKGTFIRKNKQLEKVLEELGENKQEVWDEILSNGGSVASLEFLDDYCYLDEKIRKKEELTENELMRVYEIKDVFKTFREIDQMKIVSQAAERQKFIDQSQSLNLAFHFNSSPKEFNQIHLEAWKKGIKTLYYVRTESSLNGATPSQRKTDCEWCEG